jgi:hypothetical protein
MSKFKQLREATNANPYAIGMSVVKKKMGLGAAPAHDMPKAAITKAHDIAKKIKANEEFDADIDQLDEISKQLALNYLDKAPRSARIHGQLATEFKKTAERKRNKGLKAALEKSGKKYQSKAWKREDGIKKAITKIAGDK